MTTQPRYIAAAPCRVVLPVGDTNRIEIQVLPAGAFRATDGRPDDLPHWVIDERIAAQVIAGFRARATPLVLDYEHQTLNAEFNGQPAPAAGWFRDLIWRDGAGLFAIVELTERAREYVAAGEYRFFSPVFHYDGETGEILALAMGALTNNPALDGMQAIALRAAALRLLTPQPGAPTMDALLAAVIAALNLPADTTPEAAIAALENWSANAVPAAATAELRAALGLAATAGVPEILTACAALAARQADPAKFVPVESVQQLQGQIAALSARLTARDEADVGAQIDAALADGRLLKPLESWARDLGKTNPTALTAFLAGAAPIAALVRSQTDGKPPVVDDATGLNADELAVCKNMGLTPAAYAAAKADQQQKKVS